VADHRCPDRQQLAARLAMPPTAGSPLMSWAAGNALDRLLVVATVAGAATVAVAVVTSLLATILLVADGGRGATIAPGVSVTEHADGYAANV